MRAAITALFAFCLLPFAFKAQRPEPFFRHYGTEQGLPSPEVYRVVEDGDGRIWFCTDNGISRFDGYSFENFTLRDGLPEACILRLVKDPRGRIWLDGLTRNLYLLDPAARFPAYGFNDKKRALYGGGFIDQEFLWWEEGQKMVFSLSSLGFLEVAADGRTERARLVGDGLFLKKYGSRWFVASCIGGEKSASPRPGLFPLTIDGGDGQHTHWLKGPAVSFTKCWQLSTGLVVVMRAKSFVDHFSLAFVENGTVTADFPFDGRFTQIVEETDGSLLMGMADNGGIRRYASPGDMRAGRFDTFLAGRSVNDLLRDRSGGLWAATLQDGAFYSPSTATMVFAALRPGQRDNITALEPAGDSLLFFSTYDGGLFQVRPGAAAAEPMPYEVFPLRDLCWLPAERALTALSERRSLVLKNGRQRELRYFNKEYGMVVNFGASRTSLNADGRSISFATSNGFVVMDPVSEQFDRYPKSYGTGRHPRFFDICQDPSGRTWAGTLNGLFFFEKDTLLPAPWPHPALKMRIEDIEAGSDGLLAIATKGEGLLVIEGDSVRQFSTDNGLVSNMLERVHIAPDGSVWAGSLSGLSHVFLKKEGGHGIQNFTTEQGLPSNEVSEIATFCGQTWAGTAAGLVRLGGGAANPDSPAPFLLEVDVDGKTAGDERLARLSFKENNLTVRFRTLNFRMNGRIPYRYRLLPHGGWAETQLASANFPELAPGSYLFEVKSANEDGFWSETASVAFCIAPPWWATWWFRAAALSTVAAAGFFFFKKRTDALRAQFAAKERIGELERRAVAAQMGPHFIFNCLTSIQHFIGEGDKERAMGYIDRFARLTRTVLHFSAKKSIGLDEEIAALTHYLELEKMRAGAGFSYEIKVAEGLDPAEAELPPMLVQPFVENAIKHGRAGRVTLFFEKKEGELLVEVRDDGLGLPSAPAAAAPKKGHESVATELARERLAHWNRRSAPADLVVENLEKRGVRAALKIVQG